MAKIADVTFTGQSGREYKFEVYPCETTFKDVGGVYVFSKRDSQFERRIEESVNHNYAGLDMSAELGVEIKILEKQSLSVTCVTYLFNTYGVSNFYPKFYFSVRVL